MGALALTYKEQYKTPFAPVMPGVKQATYQDLESAAKVIKKVSLCCLDPYNTKPEFCELYVNCICCLAGVSILHAFFCVQLCECESAACLLFSHMCCCFASVRGSALPFLHLSI